MSVEDYNETRAARGWPLVAAHGTSTVMDGEGFRREVVFEPGHAWTTRNNPPSSDYGRASLRIRFLLHGPKGSVQFLWSTGIMPERDTERLTPAYTREAWMHHTPMGIDVGYHADEPQYEGQDLYDCEFRASGKCYYDGSGLAGEDFLAMFLTEGEDAMWAGLRARYATWFESEADQ